MSSIPPNLPPFSPHPPRHGGGKATRATPEEQQERTDAARKNARANVEAEREVNQRMMRAEEHAKQTERELSTHLDHVRGEYSERLEAEQARQEAAYDALRNKGYERLRDLKREQERQEGQLRREGERDLAMTKQYYRDSLYKQSTDGDQKLREEQNRYAQAMNHEQRVGQSLAQQSQNEQSQRLAHLKETEDAKYAATVEETQTQYKQMRETTEAVREKGRQEFEQRYQNEIQQQSEQLSELNQTASEQLRRSRMDTAQKLAAYEERQEDPFYKLLDLNAQLHDIGDSYVLTARIPPHEQQKVNVSLKGNNQLVISGYRRNEEKLEVGPGRMKGTASHQSYSETFPLSWPVEGRKLEKYFEGDELIVKLPKKTENSVHSVYESDKKAKPERARVQRPTFPENLPNTTANPAPEAGDPALAHSTGAERKSQKTLS